jgi:hypothetical protein
MTNLKLGTLLIGTFAFLGDVSHAPAMSKASPMRRPLDTPSFYANGTHSCWSKTDIGHTCKVSGYFNDCHEAHSKLRNDDCCPRTKQCHLNPGSSAFECRYGGASVGYTPGVCLPH